jgi:PAS domain S-box-containing protein
MLKKLFEQKILLIGIIFCLIYWLIDSFLSPAALHQDTPIGISAYPPNILWKRVIVIALILIFTLIANEIYNRRRKFSEIIKTDEARYRQLASAATEGIIIHDGNKILDINPRIADMFGYDPEELIGHSPLMLAAPNSRALMDENITQASGDYIEIRALRNDDSSFLTRLCTLVSGEPDEDRIITIITESSAETKNNTVEEKVDNENDHLYQILFNSGNDPIFVHYLTEDGMSQSLIEVNDMACELLGYSREELLTKSLSELITEEESEAYGQIMQSLLDFKYTIFETAVISKKERKIPLEFSAHLFKYNDRLAVILAARDLTERKKAEESLRASEKHYRKMYEPFPRGCYQPPAGRIYNAGRLRDSKKETTGNKTVRRIRAIRIKIRQKR